MFCYVAYYNSIDISRSPRNGHYHAHNERIMLALNYNTPVIWHYINTDSFTYFSSIDIINFPNYIYILVSCKIIHSYGYKDKTYSPVTLFVPVLVILVYMFTLIYVRTGKDRKDTDRDQTLCYVYIIFYIKRGIRKWSWLYYYLCGFPLKYSPPHSFSYIKFIYSKVTIYWFQLFSLNSSSLSSYLTFSLIFTMQQHKLQVSIVD